ncbi:MAG: hypothetical protein HKN14_09100 [Marinicaulis sp.]|nr:hypothetical protein [Marinicaulis sp.]NNL87509.1 hypothetical protein [Marinicaulis sp.]
MQKLLFSLLSLTMIVACSTAEVTEDDTASDTKTMEEMREDAWAKIDKEACLENGGEVRAEGMLGLPMCVIPYGDASTVCTDGGDCEGECRADDRMTDYNAAPGEAKGICQVNNSPFGCYATITNGSVDPAICVD